MIGMVSLFQMFLLKLLSFEQFTFSFDNPWKQKDMKTRIIWMSIGERKKMNAEQLPTSQCLPCKLRQELQTVYFILNFWRLLTDKYFISKLFTFLGRGNFVVWVSRIYFCLPKWNVLKGVNHIHLSPTAISQNLSLWTPGSHLNILFFNIWLRMCSETLM